ncbi:hypothetical protein DOTSEDRAFT_36516 [Dothistroma septosporum NZE10]|uniref:Uncharacterized protein n=1 Tax=Dothistroma septosporum (strain NZE10 / CBS 128990) TaxID=675120 RepID=N1PJG7_DOTSN|nr:hypothetical protein DOTSEDRAFT_36516 [Dothistroma septosporum NZE10]
MSFVVKDMTPERMWRNDKSYEPFIRWQRADTPFELCSHYSPDMLAGAPLAVVFLSMCLPTIRGAPAISGADAPKRLGDVFNVWRGNEADSCANYYDHAVGLGKGGGKVLNDQWEQVVDMNAAALDSLAAGRYDESLTIRNHVKSFFGMAPWKTQAGTEMAPPARGVKKERLNTSENERSREMYQHILLWFRNVDGYIRRKAGKNWTANLKQPILACGSKFMHPVTPDDYDRDAKTGKPTKKKLKDIPKVATLFEKNYVFWLDAPFNTHLTAPKQTLSNPAQWPKDSDGEKHYCAAPEHTSLTVMSKSQPVFKAIIVCPQALAKDSDKGLAKPIVLEQPKDKLLDDMGIQSLYLYKQMFMLFNGEVFIEQIQEDPRERQVYVAATQSGWPGKANAWKPAGTAAKPVFVSTGIDALWLTIHDRAEDVKTGQEQQFVKGLDALNSPVNFVWFALANFMSSKTGQDWCTGQPRPANSPWMLVWSKSKNSPGPLFDEKQLKYMSKKQLERQTGVVPDSSDSDESGKPAYPASGAAGPASKGKGPVGQPGKPRPVAVGRPPKSPVAPKAGGSGTQVSTGGAQGQITKQHGAAGHLAGAQSTTPGQHGSADTSSSSGSESESD